MANPQRRFRLPGRFSATAAATGDELAYLAGSPPCGWNTGRSTFLGWLVVACHHDREFRKFSGAEPMLVPFRTGGLRLAYLLEIDWFRFGLDRYGHCIVFGTGATLVAKR